MSSSRFQVKISGQWNDYGPKEDEVLKLAFDKFVKQHITGDLAPQDHFKELVIKGRRYVVDFQKMVQVRKDNKKDYKVRPPASGNCAQIPSEAGPEGSQEALREQGDLKLACEQCGCAYTLRGPPGLNAESRSDEADWADCKYCHACWRPFLEKEEKAKDANQKQRQVQQQFGAKAVVDAGEQPHASRPGQSKISKLVVSCEKCGQPFQDQELMYLGAFSERCQPCHEHCDRNAIELAKEVCLAMASHKFSSTKHSDHNPRSCHDVVPTNYGLKYQVGCREPPGLTGF